jgi:hypothetical protein
MGHKQRYNLYTITNFSHFFKFHAKKLDKCGLVCYKMVKYGELWGFMVNYRDHVLR